MVTLTTTNKRHTMKKCLLATFFIFLLFTSIRIGTEYTKYYTTMLASSEIITPAENDLGVIEFPTCGMISTNSRGECVTKQKVPSFDDGGVVFFYHIAKTGGTTIRQNFLHWAAEDRTNYDRLFDWKNFEVHIPRIEKILVGDLKETFILEFHGQFRLTEFHSHLIQFRQLSRKSGVPIFTFTIVRDPLSFFVSNFLFFHNKDCKEWWCGETYEELSEGNLIKSATEEPQIRYMGHGELSAGHILEMICSDWAVFTTDSLKTTINLLGKRIITKRFRVAFSEANKGRHYKKTTLSSNTLSNETISYLEGISTWDRKLYDTAVEQSHCWV